MSDLLEADSIRKQFDLNQVLTDIAVRCETGDIIGLLGRNGSGKSTLLKIIFGSLHTDYKFIRINGEVLDQPFTRKNTIAYLSQENFLPKNLSVEKVIRLLSGGNDFAEFIDDEVLAKVLKTRIGDLSGGESRYLEVKILLNTKAPFVLLDEPFNGISPLHIEVIKKLIAEKSVKKGIILTDHDYRNVLDVANRYFLLFDGGLKSVKSKQDLIEWGYIPDPSF
jgi:lipopolysaccharide export system ATP-binding protein